MMSEPPAHRRSLVLTSLYGLRIDSLDDVALFLLQCWERQRNCASIATSSRDSVSSVAAS